MIRYLVKNGQKYTVTFDEAAVLDTIECNGKLLKATHKEARIIANNAVAVYLGSAPKGFTVGKGRQS